MIKLKKSYVILGLAMLLMVYVVGCGSVAEDNTWPDSGLGSMLPKPDANKIHIGYNLDDSFSADIENAKEEDFTAYVAKCEEVGFTVDVDSDSDDYTAYNEDGYKVSISFYDRLESVSIRLSTPKVNGTVAWPTIGLATLLPMPDTNVGTISIDTSVQFNAWIGETSFEDYKTYVNECVENGFDVNYSSSEKAFSADNKEGVSLSLEYQGFNTMYISMYAPDDFELETEKNEKEAENGEGTDDYEITSGENEKNESEDDVNLVDGMRPEFKDAMDSYEAFIDEYCDFMKKYAESPSDMELLADYSDYMSQYAETMEKIDAIDETELSDAELQYYLEVTGRITQKIAEVAM